MEQVWLDRFIAEVTEAATGITSWREFQTIFDAEVDGNQIAQYNQYYDGWTVEGTVINENNQGDQTTPVVLRAVTGLNTGAQVSFVLRLLEGGVETEYTIEEVADKRISARNVVSGIVNRINRVAAEKVVMSVNDADNESVLEIRANDPVTNVAVVQLVVIGGRPVPEGPDTE